MVDPRVDEARRERNMQQARALKAETERDSLRSQVGAEVKRLRSEYYRLRRRLPSQAELLRFEADRLQAILDSASTEGQGRG